MKEVVAAIQFADSILPGLAIDEGPDPRWQAIIAVEKFIESEPEAVWPFICKWGDHPQEDLRDAIATCLLEHLLEHHFESYFPRVEELASQNSLFADTFQRCWRFGQSEESANASLFNALQEKLATHHDS